MSESTLTERGQVSIPVALRKAMQLKVGQRLKWEQISDHEFRVTVTVPTVGGPLSALGYARKVRGASGRSTASWMRELRAGEEAS